jgi:uncharacterized protein (TIGR02001 family)
MKKLPYLLVLSGLISAPVLAADAAPAAPASPHTFSYNVGVGSDYIFRGISQTQHSPELSAGADYSHSSGIYLGTWLSNQKWVKAGGPFKTGSSVEWDLYGGYKGTLPADVGYDVGLINYYYNGSKVGAPVPTPDTTEAYLGLSWKMVAVKYSYAISDYFIGWGVDSTVKTKGSNYVELNVTPDLGDGWGLIAHIGHQKVKNVSIADYADWKVGVTKDVGFGTVTLAYSDTDANAAAAYTWSGKDVSKGVLGISFSKTF